ncbi:histidine kinase dimerization/phospho-acceptor domain-containing protein [Halalkalibacter akibai]|uniref:histidine kinase n=1 Tax=Halalkalibacter akibai (strain ATCC 43226 / DSM 21942 / CIP 109018 / JCM 9157 / 1139) TaxID=1236973 RepID=W4QVN5_HALA3|nr:histidine kinase dimerization/phospho-acceptor domain-containing protein [Halalkalibacter akibai]GAE36161.1 sporulation kinase C [Halalkalibacter akibai JCM 9157]
MKNEYFKQSENKVRKIINKLQIPIIIRLDTYVLLANEIAQKQFMVNEKEPVLQLFFEKFDQNFRDSPDNNQKEFHFTTNDKKKFYLVNSIKVSFEEEKAILHSFVDITHEKENEQLIVRSEKMNIAGELAASIAHELRNPLTAIKGFFKILKESEDNGQELYYRVIEDELSRIEQISS